MIAAGQSDIGIKYGKHYRSIGETGGCAIVPATHRIRCAEL
jgi:hypothetical protein